MQRKEYSDNRVRLSLGTAYWLAVDDRTCFWLWIFIEKLWDRQALVISVQSLHTIQSETLLWYLTLRNSSTILIGVPSLSCTKHWSRSIQPAINHEAFWSTRRSTNINSNLSRLSAIWNWIMQWIFMKCWFSLGPTISKCVKSSFQPNYAIFNNSCAIGNQ